MTTNSDGVLPNPGDQQPNPADAAPGTQPGQQQTQEPVPADIDDQELAAATAEVEAEKTPDGGSDGSQSQPGTQQGQQQQLGQQQDQQPQPQGGQQQTPAEAMIPKARFDEALTKQHAAELEAARWRGVAEAREQQQQPRPQGGQQQQGAQQQQPTADQRLAEIHTAQDALAAKFDNGEITMADMTKQQRDLATRERGINEEVLLARVQPAAKPAPAEGDLFLEDQTARIEQAHPWVNVYEQVGTPLDWKYVRDVAFQTLIQNGVDPTTPRGVLALREEAAETMDRLGPAMMADKAKAQGIAIPGPQQSGQQQQQQPGQGGQQQAQRAPLSPIAQARAAKDQLASTQPPNLNAMNGTVEDLSVPTSSRVEAMSDDEIGALPDAQRSKLLGLM